MYLAVMAHAAGTHSRDARTGGTHMHELAMLRLAARVTLLLILLHLLLLSLMPLLSIASAVKDEGYSETRITSL